jgi:hypothetical protein
VTRGRSARLEEATRGSGARLKGRRDQRELMHRWIPVGHASSLRGGEGRGEVAGKMSSEWRCWKEQVAGDTLRKGAGGAWLEPRGGC